MDTWKPQHFRNQAKKLGIPSNIVENAVSTAKKTVAYNRKRTPIFTLGHLAFLTGVSVARLRSFVARGVPEKESYRTFFLRKQSSDPNLIRGFRVIAIPCSDLLTVQKWICREILSLEIPHSASTAYAKECSIVKAVTPHLGCRWLIKLDVSAFFDSISEIGAYSVFFSLGYQPLVAFELARLCTRRNLESFARRGTQWHQRKAATAYTINQYHSHKLGYLPQGAPTSPMLSNLVMRKFDDAVTRLANSHGLTYTRYADDLAFSTCDSFTREEASTFVRSIYEELGKVGLSPNRVKTKIIPPGARKLLLGVLVSGDEPRLTKEFRHQFRTHLYFLRHENHGPMLHARKRGFDSIFGLRNHLFGLAYYARQIEPNYGAQLIRELSAVAWPI